MNKNIIFSALFTKANIFSILIFIISLFLISFKGLNYGIDFKGGTLIELRIDNSTFKIGQVRDSFVNLNLGDVNVKEFGKKGDYLIKIEKSDNESENFISDIKKNIQSSLSSEVNFRRVEKVGPKVSDELLKSGLTAIFLALAAMLFYIWIRFEWQFSLGSIIALIHDVVITLGIFSLLSLEVNLSIIAAVLTIVGYSMNDTVVIFDRVRENLRKYSDVKIFDLTNISINETLSRTIITSVTTLLALFSIYLFGGEILKGFSLAMILGVIFGTYSSIYIANPILVALNVSQRTIVKEEKD